MNECHVKKNLKTLKTKYEDKDYIIQTPFIVYMHTYVTSLVFYIQSIWLNML